MQISLFNAKHRKFCRASRIVLFLWKMNYLYQCGSPSEGLKNFTFMFPKNKETKIIAFGDWGISEDGIKTFNFLNQTISATDYDAIVLEGDYAYNLASIEEKDWDNGNTFLNWIMPISSPLPFMLNPGNHEWINGSFDQFTKRFLMPNKVNAQNLYYSYDINDVHFISVNSEFGFKSSEKIFDLAKFRHWFEEDTTNNNKRWKVVHMHRPLYCAWYEKPRCTSEAEQLRSFFEDLFFKAKIDIVIAGHLHNYERTFPIYKGEIDRNSITNDNNLYINPKYPVYLICGSAGNRQGRTPVYHPLSFSQYVTNETGVCEIEFKKEKMKVRFINTENITMDSFELTKSP